jgi:hypothetical protein
MLYISLTDSQAYSKNYTSCMDAFTNGKIHPEPGKPVQLVFKDGSSANCSIENLNRVAQSCPAGWYGNAVSEFCFQVNLQQVDNREACRYYNLLIYSTRSLILYFIYKKKDYCIGIDFVGRWCYPLYQKTKS